MSRVAPALAALLLLPALAGCLAPAAEQVAPQASEGAAPDLSYTPAEPDMALELVEFSVLLPGEGVDIHARILRPAGEGPFPVIAQFTPYTAPGRNPAIMEPLPMGLGATGGAFVDEFVRRGYAFAYADVRGTGDSSGCLDLRGEKDIADVGKLTDWLGTQAWSNGKVGFIGASYPGSEAHMAGIANSPYLAAVIPVVASTSFYHYHHNDGVPYMGQHSLGGTNTGYTQNAIAPTVNPQHPNYATRYVDETQCPHFENIVMKGGIDQMGTYDDWWKERNLRARAADVTVPVLMAQGLADWNVKPDHIATWFNDLKGPKTLIAGQWPHRYPKDADGAYGEWWTYATAFFDTHLKGIDTGMFTSDVAWVQDNEGDWHRSSTWPIAAEERETLTLHLTDAGKLGAAAPASASEAAWAACPRHTTTRGVLVVSGAEGAARSCEGTLEVVFESEPMERDMIVSGVPLVSLVVKSSAKHTHLVAVLEVVGKERENYGYLNPTFRHGLEMPEDVPVGEAYAVTIDLYPQEDVVKKGDKLRLTIRSHDEGRTIEAFEAGENVLLLGPENVNTLTLPLRPASQYGTRLG